MQEFLRGVALAEFLQLFEELVCFDASLSQKLAEVVMSGFSKRLVGELGHLGVDDGVDPWPREGHVHTADELLLGNAGEGIVDEPPQSSRAATLRVIGEENFDDVDVAIGGHAASLPKIHSHEQSKALTISARVVVLQPRPDSMALAIEVKDELSDLCEHVLNGANLRTRAQRADRS